MHESSNIAATVVTRVRDTLVVQLVSVLLWSLHAILSHLEFHHIVPVQNSEIQTKRVCERNRQTDTATRTDGRDRQS